MIDHTGDIGIEVQGKTLPELFRNAAYAFFDIILGKAKVKSTLEETISVSGNDYEQLLVNWLSEFLYLFETKKLIFSNIQVKKLDGKRIEAVAAGEVYNPQTHSIKTEVKAVTYHGLKIEKKGSIYSTVIIFDI